MIGSPAFRAGHDHDVTGPKENGDRFYIAGRPTEQEDCGTPDAVVIGGQYKEGKGRRSLRYGDQRGGSADL